MFAACDKGPVPPYKVEQEDPYAINFVYFKTQVSTKADALFSTSGNWVKQPDTLAVYPVQFRCTKPAPQDIVVTVEVDESLVETYNAANGTSYKFFSDLELIAADSYTIKKGEYMSVDTLKTRITNFDAFTEGGTQKYMVPVRLRHNTQARCYQPGQRYYTYTPRRSLYRWQHQEGCCNHRQR